MMRGVYFTMASRTLLVTNDFPSRGGGDDTFGCALARHLAGPDGEGAVVHTFRSGSGGFDDLQEFPVERDGGPRLMPTRRTVRRIKELMRGYDCDRVLLAEAPLGLMAAPLRAEGVGEVVAATRGVGRWGPAATSMLRRIGGGADVVAYPGESQRPLVQQALPPGSGARLVRLAPGVDTTAFRPGLDGDDLRERFDLGDGPVVLCVGRLDRRAGVDSLIRAMTWLRPRFPGVRLLVAGEGPDRRRLRALAAWAGVEGSVVFAGACGPQELPRLCAVADVFALPGRPGSPGRGMMPGAGFLEAAACGLPVVAGVDGGAGDLVRHGETGYVVDGGNARSVAQHLSHLLANPEAARAMGERGRQWVLAEWTWDRVLARLEGAPAAA
ncbi:glycosyltransferase family 4 protein [Streptomonospora nanhaiensis]|uniref:Phosphatidylinositol alpha-1,6-mannosyltransferase n=1 Tax=Streptomonospora nanhaiensis TaxID=1323731 RepID=A0A853BJ34_9ACTN|nr:glycosyltransferase family 4 protein [Streptomonospora nanhaiensis]NYI94536.1 phosphatidylinositol alpha-1,6-mannosyltransferase [Streptomonospora nanhaiensis]